MQDNLNQDVQEYGWWERNWLLVLWLIACLSAGLGVGYYLGSRI